MIERRLKMRLGAAVAPAVLKTLNHRPKSMAAAVKAMEVACVFSLEDYAGYKSRTQVDDGELAAGFKYSGSYCGA